MPPKTPASVGVAGMRPPVREETIELSVVIPCLDEATTIAGCVRDAVDFLERYGVAGEVIVADNGSTDGSRDIARDSGARIVEVETKGYGAALLGGFSSARGEYIIMGDGDG